MKIYKIITDLPDGRFLIYIGSTNLKLNERLTTHKKNYTKYQQQKYNYTTSFQILKNNWYEIVLIEDLGNCSKEYGLDKESYYIDYYKSLSDEYSVVNKYKPNGIDKTKIIQSKQKYNNSNKGKQTQKLYQQSDKYKKYHKQYYLIKKV